MSLSRLRGKTIVKDWIFFAGGFPVFRYRPTWFTWGNYLSILWLGLELVIRIKNNRIKETP